MMTQLGFWGPSQCLVEGEMDGYCHHRCWHLGVLFRHPWTWLIVHIGFQPKIRNIQTTGWSTSGVEPPMPRKQWRSNRRSRFEPSRNWWLQRVLLACHVSNCWSLPKKCMVSDGKISKNYQNELTAAGDPSWLGEPNLEILHLRQCPSTYEIWQSVTKHPTRGMVRTWSSHHHNITKISEGSYVNKNTAEQLLFISVYIICVYNYDQFLCILHTAYIYVVWCYDAYFFVLWVALRCLMNAPKRLSRD